MWFPLTAADNQGVDVHSRRGVISDEVCDAIHPFAVMVVAQSMPHDDRSRILARGMRSRLNDGKREARKNRQT